MIYTCAAVWLQCAAPCHALSSFIGKDRDPLIRDPQIVSISSLTKATLSLIDYYMSLLSRIKAISQRVSKWGSLSFPMNIGTIV